MDVTKQEFEAYERVRQDGKYNMIAKSKWAAKEAGLSIERYFAVLNNYAKCVKKWPDVRSRYYDDLSAKGGK